MKNAVITGASSGIGRALAVQMHREGFRVLGVGRDTEALKALQSSLGEGFDFITCDLRNLNCIDEIASRVSASHTPLDILVNNAGYGSTRKLLEETPEEVVGMTLVNLVAPILLVKGLLPYMRSGSVVVNVATAGIHVLMTQLPLYGATKIALHYASEALRRELAEKDIHLVEVLPGVVKTKFHARAGSQDPRHGATPEEAAREIMKAIMQRKKRVYIPWYLGLLRLLGPHLPALY